MNSTSNSPVSLIKIQNTNFQFSVAKATLHSQMSVRLSVCKTPQQLEIIILHPSSFFIHPSFILLRNCCAKGFFSEMKILSRICPRKINKKSIKCVFLFNEPQFQKVKCFMILFLQHFMKKNKIRSLLDAKSKGPSVISHTQLINCQSIK